MRVGAAKLASLAAKDPEVFLVIRELVDQVNAALATQATKEIPVGAVSGVNRTFRLKKPLGPASLVFVDGILNPGATANGLLLTTTVAPTFTIVVFRGAVP